MRSDLLAEACKTPALDGLWIYGVTVLKIVYTPRAVIKSRLNGGRQLNSDTRARSVRRKFLTLPAKGARFAFMFDRTCPLNTAKSLHC